MKKIILFTGVGYLLYKVFNKTGESIVETVNSLVFTPKGLSIDMSNFFNPILLLVVTINNPANLDFTIDSIYANLNLSDGTVLGTINNNQKINVLHNSKLNITIPISINVGNIFSKITDLSIVKERNIKIDGYYYVNGLKVPYTNSLNFI